MIDQRTHLRDGCEIAVPTEADQSPIVGEEELRLSGNDIRGDAESFPLGAGSGSPVDLPTNRAFGVQAEHQARLDAVDALLRGNRARSDRSIAKASSLSHPSVAMRRQLEQAGE